ncbi:UbiA family prenyltransferase [Amycolatopsis thermophila]|uniref:4-hydroxybenzoate polyprenyltransferase n=1 Tax=Amycolatopsis thermophila TaxID=206084 RepID=A0ABU0F2V4_9PSEU|nr:UbiA family prenyltransferase [Amycolatopsis thermophila]MDQ0381914.1 4-hydroxybenzoate polyprenyltransferase [Amycolatopsis thermophila]
MPGLTGWRAVLLVHRLHFPLPLSYLAYAWWGAAFAAAEPRDLIGGPVLVTVAATVLSLLAGLALNTAADVRTDRHDRDKTALTGAAGRFGSRRIFGWAAAEAIAAMVLAAVVALRLGRWAVPVVLAAALAAHLSYNLEPVRLKRRGLAGPAVFGAGFLAVPGMASYFAVRPALEASMVPVLAGLCVLAFGRTTWFSVPDHEADARTGIGTPGARYGPWRTLLVSCGLVAAGLLLLGAGLWWRYGAAWAITGAVTEGAFLAGMTALAGPRRSLSRMRELATPIVLLGDLSLVAIPLLAG